MQAQCFLNHLGVAGCNSVQEWLNNVFFYFCYVFFFFLFALDLALEMQLATQEVICNGQILFYAGGPAIPAVK